MTAREALEHVHGVIAIENLARGRRARQPPDGPDPHRAPAQRFIGGDDANILGFGDRAEGSTTKIGPEAEAIADKPHLTGWAEWDALELEETDPEKEPLKVKF